MSNSFSNVFFLILCIYVLLHTYIYIHTHTQVKWSSFTTCFFDRPIPISPPNQTPEHPYLHHGLSMIAIGTFRSDVEGTQPSVGFIPFVGINQMRTPKIYQQKNGSDFFLSTKMPWLLYFFSTKVYFFVWASIFGFNQKLMQMDCCIFS